MANGDRFTGTLQSNPILEVLVAGLRGRTKAQQIREKAAVDASAAEQEAAMKGFQDFLSGVAKNAQAASRSQAQQGRGETATERAGRMAPPTPNLSTTSPTVGVNPSALDRLADMGPAGARGGAAAQEALRPGGDGSPTVTVDGQTFGAPPITGRVTTEERATPREVAPGLTLPVREQAVRRTVEPNVLSPGDVLRARLQQQEGRLNREQRAQLAELDRKFQERADRRRLGATVFQSVLQEAPEVGLGGAGRIAQALSSSDPSAIVQAIESAPEPTKRAFARYQSRMSQVRQLELNLLNEQIDAQRALGESRRASAGASRASAEASRASAEARRAAAEASRASAVNSMSGALGVSPEDVNAASIVGLPPLDMTASELSTAARNLFVSPGSKNAPNQIKSDSALHLVQRGLLERDTAFFVQPVEGGLLGTAFKAVLSGLPGGAASGGAAALSGSGRAGGPGQSLSLGGIGGAKGLVDLLADAAIEGPDSLKQEQRDALEALGFEFSPTDRADLRATISTTDDPEDPNYTPLTSSLALANNVIGQRLATDDPTYSYQDLKRDVALARQLRLRGLLQGETRAQP